ncbi:MAG: hypothetical protein JW741_04860 [Sedimentisphaerales bacterium]|nr:hypothetical protein [Sedimentisphaerales bacterium]
MPLRRIAMMLTAATLVAASVAASVTAASETPSEEDIWKDEPRQPRYWWDRGLSAETIERVMAGVRKRNPDQAKELEQLRKRDEDLFKIKLREYGQPEFEQMGREYWAARRQRRNEEFLEWLKANYAKEHEELVQLKDRDTTVYVKNFETLMNRYGRIFDADRTNPELGAVLKEDLALKRTRDELRHRMRHEGSEAKRQKLGAELQEVVARRYDLIVRQKEIAYEHLLKKLADLQGQVQESKNEIKKWKDDRIKQENVRQRLKALTENRSKFRWD